MQKNGAEISKLKTVFNTPEDRGVHAASDIKKGEEILFVPFALIVTG